MRKVIILIAAVITVFSFISCEAEAKSADFLTTDDFIDLLGVDTIKEDELGLLDPPKFIAEIGGVDFFATNQIAQLSGNTLQITFISDIGSSLVFSLDGPASKTYTAGVNSVDLFEVEYTIGDGDEVYTTSPSFTSDSFGTLGLSYTPDLLLDSVFSFTAINRADGTEIEAINGVFGDVEFVN